MATSPVETLSPSTLLYSKHVGLLGGEAKVFPLVTLTTPPTPPRWQNSMWETGRTAFRTIHAATLSASEQVWIHDGLSALRMFSTDRRWHNGTYIWDYASVMLAVLFSSRGTHSRTPAPSTSRNTTTTTVNTPGHTTVLLLS